MDSGVSKQVPLLEPPQSAAFCLVLDFPMPVPFVVLEPLCSSVPRQTDIPFSVPFFVRFCPVWASAYGIEMEIAGRIEGK